MGEAACTCEEPELVPVKDRNMAPSYVSGNPYSRYCLGCGRRYFCKDYVWESSDEKYVIPKGEEEPVPIEEFDDENFFECPECGAPHFGFPDSCGDCGVGYTWEDEDE